MIAKKAGHKANLGGNDEYTVITFDDWEKVLKASIPLDRYPAYWEAIVKFRYRLRETYNVPNVKPLSDIWSASNCMYVA
jgi:hypothetical protein